MTSHLVVVGQMASGKSTVGRLLAPHLGARLSDSDAWIQRVRGMTAAGLRRVEGLDALHDAEAEHLARALGATRPMVIAAAASVADRPRLVDRLRSLPVVWLRASVPTLVRRASQDPERPMPADAARYLADLVQRRDGILAGVASLVVQVDRMPPDRIAAIVIAHLRSEVGFWDSALSVP